MRFRRWRWGVAVGACLLAGGLLGSRTRAESSSDSKELLPYPPVTLSVIATDARGKLVEDLTAEDFKAVDNGVAQKDLSIGQVQGTAQFTLVLVFDLLNSSVQERVYEATVPIRVEPACNRATGALSARCNREGAFGSRSLN